MIEGFTKESLLRPETDSLLEYEEEKLGNLNFNISTGYFFNFDTPQPALTLKKLILYYNLGIFPQMKDPSNIHKGFYVKKLTEEEKEKLKNIINRIIEVE
jgi:hypothetical protein